MRIFPTMERRVIPLKSGAVRSYPFVFVQSDDDRIRKMKRKFAFLQATCEEFVTVV